MPAIQQPACVIECACRLYAGAVEGVPAHKSCQSTGLCEARGILPLNDVSALNRLAATLCDVLETTLAVSPPTPAHDAVAVPALTPQEFLFSELLDGPRPAIDIERMAREQHGWPPRVLFKARQALRVKAMRRGFGPGGCWIWKLPEEAAAKASYFRPDEWRSFIAGHRGWPSAAA